QALLRAAHVAGLPVQVTQVEPGLGAPGVDLQRVKEGLARRGCLPPGGVGDSETDPAADRMFILVGGATEPRNVAGDIDRATPLFVEEDNPSGTDERCRAALRGGRAPEVEQLQCLGERGASSR